MRKKAGRGTIPHPALWCIRLSVVAASTDQECDVASNVAWRTELFQTSVKASTSNFESALVVIAGDAGIIDRIAEALT